MLLFHKGIGVIFAWDTSCFCDTCFKKLTSIWYQVAYEGQGTCVSSGPGQGSES